MIVPTWRANRLTGKGSASAGRHNHDQLTRADRQPTQSETCTVVYTTTEADVNAGGVVNTEPRTEWRNEGSRRRPCHSPESALRRRRGRRLPLVPDWSGRRVSWNGSWNETAAIGDPDGGWSHQEWGYNRA